MFFQAGLYICFQYKQMFAVIFRILFQAEVIFICLAQINFLIESGNGLFAVCQVSGRSCDIYKTCISEIWQMIDTVLVCSDTTQSVCHYHIGYAFAVAGNGSFNHSCFIQLGFIQCFF